MTRRAKTFWWVAALVLPLLNPIAFFFLQGGVAGLIAVALADLLVLLWLATRAWPDVGGRRARHALGVLLVVVLSVPCGYAEIIALIVRNHDTNTCKAGDYRQS